MFIATYMLNLNQRGATATVATHSTQAPRPFDVASDAATLQTNALTLTQYLPLATCHLCLVLV